MKRAPDARHWIAAIFFAAALFIIIFQTISTNSYMVGFEYGPLITHQNMGRVLGDFTDITPPTAPIITLNGGAIGPSTISMWVSDATDDVGVIHVQVYRN